jgi:hypothetical protein
MSGPGHRLGWGAYGGWSGAWRNHSRRAQLSTKNPGRRFDFGAPREGLAPRFYRFAVALPLSANCYGT